jgi:hypothetical protein
LRERQLEQQWQHLYSSQFLTQLSEKRQQFQQQLKTLRLQQQDTKGSDEQGEQQQQPQPQQRCAKVPQDVKSGLMWPGIKATAGSSSQPKDSSSSGSDGALTDATGAATVSIPAAAAAAAAAGTAAATDLIA